MFSSNFYELLSSSQNINSLTSDTWSKFEFIWTSCLWFHRLIFKIFKYENVFDKIKKKFTFWSLFRHQIVFKLVKHFHMNSCNVFLFSLHFQSKSWDLWVVYTLRQLKISNKLTQLQAEQAKQWKIIWSQTANLKKFAEKCFLNENFFVFSNYQLWLSV